MPDWDGEETGFTTATPNGWEITYEPKPKRRYLVDKIPVQASITEILRCLDKPALTWWGQCVGIAAGLELYLRGFPPEMLLHGKPDEMAMVDWARLIAKGPVTDLELSTNHVRDAASTRGQTVHSAFSYWATTSRMPNPHEYPEHEQGYVLALIAFLRDVPTLSPQGIELAVASKKHSYAGRYDLRGKTSQEHRVVTKVYDKSPAKTVTIPPGLFLWDLKTSVDIFPEHALQLAGYEQASVESGYPETDGQLVVQLGGDGRYQCRRSRASGEDFLAVKACWEALGRANQGLKIPYHLEREEQPSPA